MVARSRPAPAKRITKAKQLSKKKKMTISTTFSSSEDEDDVEAKKASRKKKGKKSVDQESTAEVEDDHEELIKQRALKASVGIRVQKLHKSIVEHKHSQFVIWKDSQPQQSENAEREDEKSRNADDSDEEEVSLSARIKSKVLGNKKDDDLMKKPKSRAIRKSTSSSKAISFDSSEGESINLTAALDAVDNDKLSEEQTLGSPKRNNSKASKSPHKDVLSNQSQSASEGSEEEHEPEGTVLPDSLRGAPELRQFWRILALEVGGEEEVDDLRTDTQLERRVLEVSMGDVVSRELEKKAEARRHKEDQRHLAQHNLRNMQVNVNNIRKTDDWNSECEEELERLPSKEERSEELKKGLKLIKTRLEQRLGRSPSVAKSTKKQRKSKNKSDGEDSSPEPEIKSKSKKTTSKITKTESKKSGDISGDEPSIGEKQNSKVVDVVKEQKNKNNPGGKSDASDMEAEINALESEVKELKENAKDDEGEDANAKSESDSKKKIDHSSDDELNLESFLSENEDEEKKKEKKREDTEHNKKEKSKIERVKAEKEKADKDEDEKKKVAKEKARKDAAEEKARKEAAEEKARKEEKKKERAEKIKAEQEKAVREKTEKEKAEKEKTDRRKAEKDQAEKEKVEKEKLEKEKPEGSAEKEKAQEKTSDKDQEVKSDAIPSKNALAALSDSDDDFPAPVGAEDSDKEDIEEGKSMEEKLKQKLKEKESEKREAKSKEENENSNRLKEQEVKDRDQEREVGASKKTALASLSDSDDDLPPPVNAAVSDSDSGQNEDKGTLKKDSRKSLEPKEKSGRSRTDDESEEHKSKKVKKDHKDRDPDQDVGEKKSKHKWDKEETREEQELKEILEAGFSAVAPSQYGTLRNRFDPDRRYKERREEKKQKRKKIVIEETGMGNGINLDSILGGMDKIAPKEKKKKKENDSEDDLPNPVSSNKEEKDSLAMVPALPRPESPKIALPENTWSWTLDPEKKERMMREAEPEEPVVSQEEMQREQRRREEEEIEARKNEKRKEQEKKAREKKRQDEKEKRARMRAGEDPWPVDAPSKASESDDDMPAPVSAEADLDEDEEAFPEPVFDDDGDAGFDDRDDDEELEMKPSADQRVGIISGKKLATDRLVVKLDDSGAGFSRSDLRLKPPEPLDCFSFPDPVPAMAGMKRNRKWKEEEERRLRAEVEAAAVEEEQRVAIEMAAAEEMMESLMERKGPSTPAGDGPECSDQDYEEYEEEEEEEKVDERERTPSPFLSTNRHYPWLYGGNDEEGIKLCNSKIKQDKKVRKSRRDMNKENIKDGKGGHGQPIPVVAGIGSAIDKIITAMKAKPPPGPPPGLPTGVPPSMVPPPPMGVPPPKGLPPPPGMAPPPPPPPEQPPPPPPSEAPKERLIERWGGRGGRGRGASRWGGDRNENINPLLEDGELADYNENERSDKREGSLTWGEPPLKRGRDELFGSSQPRVDGGWEGAAGRWGGQENRSWESGASTQGWSGEKGKVWGNGTESGRERSWGGGPPHPVQKGERQRWGGDPPEPVPPPQSRETGSHLRDHQLEMEGELQRRLDGHFNGGGDSYGRSRNGRDEHGGRFDARGRNSSSGRSDGRDHYNAGRNEESRRGFPEERTHSRADGYRRGGERDHRGGHSERKPPGRGSFQYEGLEQQSTPFGLPPPPPPPQESSQQAVPISVEEERLASVRNVWGDLLKRHLTDFRLEVDKEVQLKKTAVEKLLDLGSKFNDPRLNQKVVKESGEEKPVFECSESDGNLALKCTICGVTTSGIKTMGSHLGGKKHLINMGGLRVVEGAGVADPVQASMSLVPERGLLCRLLPLHRGAPLLGIDFVAEVGLLALS